VVVSEAQALSAKLIDFEQVRLDRLRRPSVVSEPDATALESGAKMLSLDVDGAAASRPLEDPQWPVASLNKAIRDVEDRVTKELRDAITSHDPSPVLRNLRTEVTQVRSRLDELNQRIEKLCAASPSRLDREDAPPQTDIGALETLLAELAGKIDSAIADPAKTIDVAAPIGELEILEGRQYQPTTITARGEPTFGGSIERIPTTQVTWRHALEALEELGARLEQKRSVNVKAKESGGPNAFRALSPASADVAPGAGHSRVKLKSSAPKETESAQGVRLTLIEALHWILRRGVAEIKSMRRRKFPHGDLWTSHAAKESFLNRLGERDRLSSQPSPKRAFVLGIAAALLALCAYSLFRPGSTGSNLVSPNAPEKAVNAISEQGGAKSSKFGLAAARATGAESATGETERSGRGHQSLAAPPPHVLGANPPPTEPASTRDSSGWSPPPKSTPNAGPNMSEAEVQALAAQGDPRAQYELATRLLMRQEKGPDAKVAADWLEKAANQGFALAQLRLGILYGKGVGVNRDYTLARKWFQTAAEKGNALAMHNLAVLLSEGHGRKPNHTTANAWFRKAAELGVMDSQYNLGLDYMQGLGVERDLVQAYAWFAAAGAAGDTKASKKRKEIAALLDPEELEDARALADRLKQKQASTQADE
jgi:TPR repeat protein